jgi:hypothetical protein
LLGAAINGAVGVDDAAWDHSVFSKNRERPLEGDIAAKLLSGMLAHPRVKRLLSTDHFSVDGTLIEAWASMKSFRPKDGLFRTARVPRSQNGFRSAQTLYAGTTSQVAGLLFVKANINREKSNGSRRTQRGSGA